MAENQVTAAVPEFNSREFVLTDCNRDLSHDADLQLLQPGQKLWAVDAQTGLADAPAKERITFNPHPKTLTMAGDYEYFAAQGKSPFPFALAELIDNSLRAVQHAHSPQRSITVTLVLNTKRTSGLLSVWDNGVGMTKQQLNEWAVMNLSMEDRGLQPEEVSGRRADAGVGRFLAGNLSYFGVGSKNAAFYLGRCIKMSTKQAEGRYVHELSISASDLEQRYKQGQAVYEDDLVHRCAGDASTLLPMEAPFPIARSWVEHEAEQQDAEEAGPDSSSFTRVVIGQLKADILRQVAEDAQGQKLCRALAHLYHYYLHGEDGGKNGGEGGSQQAPSQGHKGAKDKAAQAKNQANSNQQHGQPRIVMECMVGTQLLWRTDLAEVTDDLKSRYQAAQQAQLTFNLNVPSKGMVAGVLYYFPYQGGQETLPMEDSPAFDPGDTTVDLTQQGTQATQRDPGLPGEGSGEEEGGRIALWQRSRAPLLECFWQGRLIPGSRVESLPFIEAVRLKRRSGVKDALPDEVFLRLRGALFFGPGFLVTRNKLNFRDNLLELLSSAVPEERNLEKKFRKWLGDCHAQLDKHVRFEGLQDAAMQAQAREWCGATCTAFRRVAEGAKVVNQGDVVRLSGKPPVVGAVLCFTVNKVVEGEGVYAGGSVTVQPYPLEVWGSSAHRTAPLRRLDAVVGDDEGQEFCSQTSVAVMNGLGNKVVQAFMAGSKQGLVVTQRLWWLTDVNGGKAEVEVVAESPPKPAKKNRRGKDKSAPAPAAAPQNEAPTPGKLVAEVENSTPEKDAFVFAALADMLTVAGQYRLEYTLTPALPEHSPLTTSVAITVTSGPAASMSIQGEGRIAAATGELLLGQHLPPLILTFQDMHGNTTAVDPDNLDELALEVMTQQPDGSMVIVPDLAVVADMESSDDAHGHSNIHLLGVHILGSPSHTHPTHCLPSLAGPANPQPSSTPQGQASEGSQAAPTAEVGLCVVMAPLPHQVLLVRVRPGAPHCLRLTGDTPWQSRGNADPAGSGQQALTAAQLACDSTLPPFSVQVHDMWNNPSGSCQALAATVVLECTALEPSHMEVAVPSSGIVCIEGCKAVAREGNNTEADNANITLTLKSEPADLLVEAAMEAASPVIPLQLPLAVLPSAAPCALVLMHNETRLPLQAASGAEEGPVALLPASAAGCAVEGLTFLCVDGSGRPAAEGVAGKVQVSWTRGSKKTKLKQAAMPLPALQVQDQVDSASPLQHWVRFTSSGFTLECGLSVPVVPGPPAVWSMTCMDGASQVADDSADITCDSFFNMEIEAMDQFCNSCGGALAERVPVPRIVPEAEQPLEWDEGEWEQGWTKRESGDEVWAARMKLRGLPGKIRIHVRDESGEEGASLLRPDFLDLNLAAGPPSKLSFEGPPAITCSTKAVLGQLRVRATDVFGNVATHGCGGIEVELGPGEPGHNGASCVVAAANNNIAKLRKGTATFREVSFAAEQAGAYTLQARSITPAKLDAQASLVVNAEVVNRVSAVSLHMPSRGDVAAAAAVTAGDAASICVSVATEDGQGINADLAAEGLSLTLNTPDKRRLTCSLTDATHSDRVAHSQGSSCTFTFKSEALALAGSYVATAEYVEHRQELAEATHTGRAGLSCDRPMEFEVQPGEPATLVPSSSARSLPNRCSATNGPSGRDRLLLPSGVSFQLKDAHGNDVHREGVPVAMELASAARVYEGELPSLKADEQLQQTTDSIGKEKEELLQQRRAADGAADKAAAELGGAETGVERLARQVRGPVPQTVQEAQQMVQQLRQELAEPVQQPEATALEAAYGLPNLPMTASIDWCLQQGDPEVLGVFAQLTSSTDEALARVLSAGFGGMMKVVVVSSNACRQRLTQRLEASQRPVPDIMCTSHTQPFRAHKGEVPGVRNASARAQQLMAEACSGSDACLPWALPHARALANRDPSGFALGPNDWPEGCLGYGVNLVRPVVRGHRALVLYPMMGPVLVFETLEHASNYREYITQELKSNTSDIVTLDMRKISSKGIVFGSSFHVAPLADMPAHFAFAPSGGGGDSAAAKDQQVAAVERLAEAMQKHDEAAAACDAARQEAEQVQAGSEEQLQRLQAEIAAVDGQLADNRTSTGAAGTKHALEHEEEERQEQRPGKQLKKSRKGKAKKRASEEGLQLTTTVLPDDEPADHPHKRSRRVMNDMDSE
ncbi:hypothetical protein WJX73_002958 [Symbiochloris irregularis]|uniref:SMCHD1 ribosomal S5 domain-containing protein n=1 Tax=Symbiochloris irregularis TaxID=706552 RepID=A0AAW1P0C6_9CHLO